MAALGLGNRLLLCLYLIVFCSHPVAANTNEHFNKVLIDNNLPNVGIYSITQDNLGYLWLASTNTGLIQYDGYQFKKHSLFSQKLSQFKSMPDIDALVFDQHNNLWAGTWGYGLAKVSAQTGDITLYNGDADALAGTFVQTLFKDKQQRIWIGTTSGINRFDDTNGLVRVDTPDDLLPNRRVWAFAQTPDGTLWLATSNGLLSWHDNTGFSPALFPHGAGSANNEIRALHVIGEQLWIGTRAGLFLYLPGRNTLQQVVLPEDEPLPIINTLATSANGHLLIGTFNGIFTLDVTTQQFLRAYRNQLVQLSHVNVRTIFVDKSQVTWVGTRENGLMFKTRQKAAFQNLNSPALERLQQGLNAPVLTVLAETRFLWLGQYDKIIRYASDTGSTVHFPLPGRVNSITRAPDGSVWAGSDSGLFLFDDHQQQFVDIQQPYHLAGLRPRNARQLVFIDNDTLLINVWQDGILLYNRSTQSVTHLLADIDDTLIGDAIQAALPIEDHIWLVSRLSGVYKLSNQNNEPRAVDVDHPLLKPDYIGQLTCLSPGPENTLLLCSEQGLLRIWPLTGQVTLLVPASAIPQAWLVGAHTDRFNNIWLLTTSGLVLIKPDGTVRHFDTSDGLHSNELMFSAVAEDNSRLYFGSDAGLEIVNPAMLLTDLPVMPQAVSQITFDGKPHSSEMALTALTDIIIPATTSRLAFHFAYFDFNQPGRNHYLYKLTGFDDDWQQLTNTNVANYTNLAPGRYTLQLRASNQLQPFNEQISTVNIEVLPHWWQRKSVQALALLVVILSIGYIVNKRLTHIRRLNLALEKAVSDRTKELQTSLQRQQAAYAELQQLDELKDQFISNVSHELRTPLTAIKGALDMVTSGMLKEPKQQQKLLAIASSNSKRLTLLINDLLDLEKLSAQQMVFHLQPHRLDDIVRRSLDENSTYQQLNKVQFCYQAAPDCIDISVVVDENRLLQVLANLLSNALKFSPEDGIVTVKLQRQNNQAVVSVSDQGPGIADNFKGKIFQRFAQANNGNTRQQGGTGLGLALCKELMTAMHGEIDFLSSPGQGTTFYLRFNLSTVQQ